MLDVRLRDILTGDEVRFSPAPELLSRSGAATAHAFTPLRGRERQRPKGSQAEAWTLEHTFFGGSDAGSAWAPFDTWRPPVEVERILLAWVGAGGRPPSLLTLTAASTEAGAVWPSLSRLVQIGGYTLDWGHADALDVSLTLLEVSPILLEVDASAVVAATPTATAPPTTTATAAASDGGPIATRYVVKAGDTLATIAALPTVYGDASKWQVLFDANKDPIIAGFTDFNLLTIGWELTIPGNG